jgi:thioredoxin-like negative regulator of GroEL
MQIVINEDEIPKVGLTFVYVFAKWIVYHKKYQKMVPILESKFNIKVYAIDSDVHKDFIKKYKIEYAPALLAIKDGNVIKCSIGAMLMSAMRTWFADILSSEAKT